MKVLGVVCLVAACGAAGELLANCQSEGPYPVRQCSTAQGTPAWFAPAPVGSGPIQATWWVLGAGNRPVVDPTLGVSSSPVDGDGFIDTPNPGVFIGVDSGALTVGVADGTPAGGLDLIPAAIGTGSPLATGGLCFSAAANWGLPFVDGCSDQNRTYSVLGGGVDASDNYLDPYFSAATGGPGTASTYGLVDAPMATLLTEGTNRYFAVAFFSSTNRFGDPNDIFDKGYNMGAITNGDPNPVAPSGNNNIVPWQAIPSPIYSTAIDPNNDRILSLGWPALRIVRDTSSRLNPGAVTDGAAGRHTLGTDRLGSNLTGVGVEEQPELISYLVQRKPIVGTDCDPNQPWVSAGPPVVQALATPPGSPMSTSVTVPPDTCVRLTTHFGRIPSETAGTTANLATRNSNRFAAQAGNLGDLGYEVSSAARKIGGPLAADRPVLKSASFDQKNLVVVFETLGEMAVRSFQIVAKDRRGATNVVATVECAQCSSGVGSDYRVEVPGASLRTAKSVYVVAQPSGTTSNEIAIGQGPTQQPPEAPSRGRTNR
jgi:hypothetical protein